VSWQERAACQGQPTSLFYPGKGQSDKKAKAFCKVCPVTCECLDFARENECDTARFGIYGGLGPEERNRLYGTV